MTPTSSYRLMLRSCGCVLCLLSVARGAVDYVNATTENQTIRVNYDSRSTVTTNTRKYTTTTTTQGYFESDGGLRIYFVNDQTPDVSNQYSYTVVATRYVDYSVEPNSTISIQDGGQTNVSSTLSSKPPQHNWFLHYWNPNNVGTVFDIYAVQTDYEETSTTISYRTTTSYVLLTKDAGKARSPKTVQQKAMAETAETRAQKVAGS